MISKDATYVVMGLLDPDSIAFAIGKTISQFGGKVIYTMQNERMKRIFFDRSKKLSKEEKEGIDIRFCDITIEEEVAACFADLDNIAGVVHAIAYLNPKTGLGEEFHTDATDDLKNGFHISSVSLATVTRHAAPKMTDGGGVVALTFDSRHAFPFYNWMSVNKAALEAVVRGLARRHGQQSIRINAISAGPLSTKAAKNIPGFQELQERWDSASPITWDVEEDHQEVANAVSFLLGPYAAKITGQTIYVDGGACIMGSPLLDHER